MSSYSFKISLTFDVIDDPDNHAHMQIVKDALPKILQDAFGEHLRNVTSTLDHAKPINEN